MKNEARRLFGPVALAATLALTWTSGCTIQGSPDNIAPVDAGVPDGGGGAGGSGGEGGAGGGGGGSDPGDPPFSGHPVMDWAAAGGTSTSKQYKMIYSVGQGSINQGKSTSKSYQVQGGLVTEDRSQL